MNQVGVSTVLLNEFNTYLNMYKKMLDKITQQGEFLALEFVEALFTIAYLIRPYFGK